MSQSRRHSLLEQLLNVGSGFAISLAFWSWVVVPVWHLPVQTAENLQITAAFTVLSIARGYVWRRVFDRITRTQPEKQCAWAEDNEHTWHTSCGNAWGFFDGGPEDNDIKHCHGCGLPVRHAQSDTHRQENA